MKWMKSQLQAPRSGNGAEVEEQKESGIARLKALPAVSGAPAGQRRAAGRIVAFFLLMLALTLFARGISGATLTQVETVHTEGRTVTEVLKLTGQLESQTVQPLILPEGLTVQGILVTQGQQVKAGDGLLTVEPDSLQQAIARAQGELDKLNAELAGYEQPQKVDSDQLEAARTGYQRAQEDYQSSVAQQDTLVSRAEQNVTEANARVAQAESALETLRAEKAEWEETVAAKREQLAQLQQQSEASPELEQQIAALQEELAGEEAHGAALDGEIGSAESELETARQQAAAAAEALEDARTAAAEARRNGERGIQDARTVQDQAQNDYNDAVQAADLQDQQNQADAQILSVSIEQKRQQLEELDHLQQAEGVLKAPSDGRILTLTGEAGDASETVQIRLGEESDGYVLTLDIEKGTELQTGAAITVTQGEQSGETTLAALAPKEEGGYTATAYLTGDQWKDGTVKVQIVKSSSYYERTVPVSAYHNDNGGGFLYVVEQKETVLGLQYVVRRENVNLLASDGEVAAVEGILSNDSQIVRGSGRSIQEGERVRVSTS